jgi:3-oxoacyl-[acyl-carrier-protein] synthase II
MFSGNRVVVTGMGVLAPNGISLSGYWETLLACESGIGPITLFDASNSPLKIAGEVKGFRLADYVQGVKAGRMARHTQLALAAVSMALDDAGLDKDALHEEAPLPVVFGVTGSAIEVIERGKDAMAERGPEKISPHIVSSSQPHAISCELSEMLGVKTRALTVACACPAGLDAVAAAASQIRSGKADLAVAGGTDAAINPLGVAMISASGLVPDCDGRDPRTVSRPFDLGRLGGIMAEGCGALVLERLENALARGRQPYLEIKGYASNTDAAGAESGSGLYDSMHMALANAGRRPGDVDYICAHGPSDPVIDRVETAMIRQVMGAHAYSCPVSSIKGVTGNPLTAAGPHQLVTCALAIRDRCVPPTANWEQRDPACDLDYVPRLPRKVTVDCAMVNVHGLGGGNSSMIVERPVLP